MSSSVSLSSSNVTLRFLPFETTILSHAADDSADRVDAADSVDADNGVDAVNSVDADNGSAGAAGKKDDRIVVAGCHHMGNVGARSVDVLAAVGTVLNGMILGGGYGVPYNNIDNSHDMAPIAATL